MLEDEVKMEIILIFITHHKKFIILPLQKEISKQINFNPLKKY